MRAGTIGGAVVLLCFGWLLACWPYLLGTWLAVSFGAGPDSGARAATGWLLEAAYLAAVPVLVALSRGRDPGPLATVLYGTFGVALLASAAVVFGVR